MKLIENHDMHGHFKIFTKEIGETKWNLVVDQNNLILNTGRELVAQKLNGEDTTSFLQSFALGTGTTPPVVSNTGLELPVKYSGDNIYKPFEEYTIDDFQTSTFVGYLSSLEPVTMPVVFTEIGLFTGTLEDKGVAYCRATFEGITKTASLEIRIEYTVRV
jgi:hypothetical protein